VFKDRAKGPIKGSKKAQTYPTFDVIHKNCNPKLFTFYNSNSEDFTHF